MPSPSEVVQPSALMGNYARQPVNFVRGEGCELIDDQGRRYLDAFSGVAVSILGHNHPAIVEAVCDQVRTVVHVSNHYEISSQERLAQRLVDLSFPGKVLFGNSGTEAVEAALKLARARSNLRHGGTKPVAVAFENGFHGRTVGALSITSTPAYREPFEPLLPTRFLPFGDPEAATEGITDDVAAVFVEVVQGEGGLDTAPPGFLAHLRELCDRAGALLVVDEIQTGLARTGTFFAYQHDGVVPDIITLAKGLGGGVPIGAIVASDEVAGLFSPGRHGSTFGGNPLACAAANAVLDVVSGPGFVDHVNEVATQLEKGLASLFPGKPVLGRGLLRGARPDQPIADVVTACRDHGLVVGPAGQNTVRIAPPLVITSSEIDRLLDSLGAAINSLL
jgi:acetylornithine/N-succinyldiaminopimelate aminotransferase